MAYAKQTTFLGAPRLLIRSKTLNQVIIATLRWSSELRTWLNSEFEAIQLQSPQLSHGQVMSRISLRA